MSIYEIRKMFGGYLQENGIPVEYPPNEFFLEVPFKPLIHIYIRIHDIPKVEIMLSGNCTSYSEEIELCNPNSLNELVVIIRWLLEMKI